MKIDKIHINGKKDSIEVMDKIFSAKIEFAKFCGYSLQVIGLSLYAEHMYFVFMMSPLILWAAIYFFATASIFSESAPETL